MENRPKKSNSKGKRQPNEEQNAYSAKSAAGDNNNGNEKTKNSSGMFKSLEKVSSGIQRNGSAGKTNEKNLNEQAKGDGGGKTDKINRFFY